MCNCTAYKLAKLLMQGRPVPAVIRLGVLARVCPEHPACGGVE